MAQQTKVAPAMPPAAIKELFARRIVEVAGAAGEGQGRAYSAAGGWLFSRQEISHMAKGQFWGDAAQTTSVAVKPESRDPLAAIVDFKQQLDRAGIELILVPVPAKAHVYPDAFLDIPDGAATPLRVDPFHQQFLTILQQARVDCLDLTTLFMEARLQGGVPVFLRTDTHWSPEGIALVSRALKDRLAKRDWLRDIPKHRYVRRTEKISIKGDLTDGEPGATGAREEVVVSTIHEISNGAETAVRPDRDSPIVLLGDSHTLIFSAGGDMHASGSGFLENLAYELGVSIDVVGVRGSGATPARVELARRRDNMAGKKLVIWCFTVREYTESTTGWRKVGVIR